MATVELFLLDGGGRQTTASFTVDEALSVNSMFSNELDFHKDFYAILMFDNIVREGCHLFPHRLDVC